MNLRGYPIMNDGQKMFHDFFLSMVKEGNEKEAEKALAECFERQDNGTFNAEYLAGIAPKLFSLIQPECTEQLKKAMGHFSSNL